MWPDMELAVMKGIRPRLDGVRVTDEVPARVEDLVPVVVVRIAGGADVILMAFSNPGYSESLQEAIDYAWDSGVVLVAAAGPGMNLLIAVGSALALHLIPETATLTTATVSDILTYSIIFNVMIGVFNMIPIPPLDGGRVAVGLLPNPLAYRLARLERFGMIILLIALIGLPFIGQQMGIDLNVVWQVVQGLTRLALGAILQRRAEWRERTHRHDPARDRRGEALAQEPARADRAEVGEETRDMHVQWLALRVHRRTKELIERAADLNRRSYFCSFPGTKHRGMGPSAKPTGRELASSAN